MIQYIYDIKTLIWIQKIHLTYTEPGADMVGQVVVVHLSLTLPYNKSIWLKKAKATKRMEKYTFLFPSSSANLTALLTETGH